MKNLYLFLFLFLLCGNVKAQTIDLPADKNLLDTIASLTAGTYVINLPAGSTYAEPGETIIVPLDVNLTISGPAVGVKPIIQYKLFDVTDNTTTSISFKNVELVCGTGTTDQYFINFGSTRICTMTKIEFKNCIIRDYLRSVVRSQGTPQVINEVIFDSCIVRNIGIQDAQNYALISGAGEIKKITIKNSTLTNMVKGFIDLKNVGADEINILDCTFNNNIVDTRSFINLQSSITKTALALNVANTIFGSTQQTANNVKGINNAATTLVITQTVTNSFKTSDWILASGDFDNLTAYSGASTALFTAPVTGDFTFKDADFTGKSSAGDPRWRSAPENQINLPADKNLLDTIASMTAGTYVINLPAGSTYAEPGETIIVPLDVNLIISGPSVGVKPIIQYKLFDVTDNTTTSISFRNVELVCGTGTTDQYLINFGSARICTITKIEFKNCVIRDYLRSVVRSQGTTQVINEVIFDNCIVKNIGIQDAQNYALISGAGEIKKITIKNSTLTNMVKGFIDLKNVGADEINILDCTFNNNIVDTRSFINLQSSITKTALALNVANTIFGSTQQTANNVKGINNAATTLVITQTVTNSFKTSDWILLSGDFDNLTAYSGASTALFTDPAAGIFNFLDAGFTGKASAGDPRWRSAITDIRRIENNKRIHVLRYAIEVDEEIAEISLYNLQGKLMKRTIGKQISIEELHSGLYIVSVLSDGKRYTTKFVKQ